MFLYPVRLNKQFKWFNQTAKPNIFVGNARKKNHQFIALFYTKSKKPKKYIHYVTFFFLSLEISGLSTATIRNVSLQVDPPSVRRGQHATFICSFDLDGAPLYSVKFYRGIHEFYRYSPSELPTSKVFQFVGFNVDVSSSNIFGQFNCIRLFCQKCFQKVLLA